MIRGHLKIWAFWLACAFATAGATTPVYAQSLAAQKTGQAQVVIVTPLSFVTVSNLNFGKLIASNQAGTVTLSPANVRTVTNGIIPIGNGTQIARFAGFGRSGQNVDISISSNTIFLTGPGTRMRVRDFVIGSTPTAVLSTVPRRFRIASTNGAFTFPIGATLEVGANQAPGVYNGTYQITLQYQ
jgi:Domain of unknown function (DUF4402)